MSKTSNNKNSTTTKEKPRRSWQEWDKICEDLGRDHPSNSKSLIEVMQQTYGRPSSLDCKNDKKVKCELPRVVNIKGTRDQQPPVWDVYIGRSMTQGGWQLNADSIWANPCRANFKTANGKPLSLSDILVRYRRHILRRPDLIAQLHTLSGKRLGCWCAPAACHGDVLVALFRELFEETEAATSK